MVSRLFLVYTLVELAAVVALAATIGLGWTLLVLLGTFVVGIAVAGSQVTRQLGRLATSRGTITDSALVALGTVLVVVPGLVTSAAGLLLLLPPTRATARPLLTTIVARRIATNRVATRWDRPDVIDGEVIDVTDTEPPAWA